MKKLLLILFVTSFMTMNAGKTDTLIQMSADKIIALKSLIHRNDSLIEKLKSNTPEIPDSSQVTFSKVYSDVKGGIQGLASSLKVGAEHVYEVLVRQQVVRSITYLVFFIIGLIFLWLFIKKYKDSSEDWIVKGTDGLPSFVGLTRFCQLVIGFISIGVAIAHIEVMVAGLINPEYGAIQDIINFVK